MGLGVGNVSCVGVSDDFRSVQVNVPAESGEMGILSNHVPSIEQLKPGLVEIIEESGGSKQFFRMLWDPSFECGMVLVSCLLRFASERATKTV